MRNCYENYYDFTYDSLDRITQKRYNGDGQRVSKTVNGTKTEYYYNDSILAGEKTGNNTTVFMYDNNGDAFGFTYNGKEYYYIKNAQNDVTAIADSSGKVVANYQYDAWGKLLEVTGTNTDIANANPIRYRSYYYDSDTELYYLNTRYYSPDMCRFINADSYIQTGQDILDKNMFAYCFNNPIILLDSTGNWPTWSQVFTVVAVVAVTAVFVAAVVASAGAVGVAAGVAVASIGATGTAVSAAITVGTVGTYAVAAGIAAFGLSDAGEVITGTNVIRDKLMNGNQDAYDNCQTILGIAGGTAIMVGLTNPGVTGKAAKPSSNAQNVHSVSKTSTPKTTFDKLYSGNNGYFQRTYYDFRGNASLQIDFTNHGNPFAHANPHLHFWNSNGRTGKKLNLWYLER